MKREFLAFRDTVTAVCPRIAVVLGSGLSGATDRFVPTGEVSYADVPGMALPSVQGHRGRLAVGMWAGVPALIGFGRMHFYEGHAWDRVTTLVQIVAELGVKTVLLTNAAGGIHPQLLPGELMAIRSHFTLLDPSGWKTLASPNPESSVYSARLLNAMQHQDSTVIAGTYAALTGPCYETPAEIRAWQKIGADAVGMSTAKEAEAAAAAGLEVAGLSCITNRAAGLSDGPLSHGEVEATASRVIGRVSEWMTRFVGTVG